MNLSVNPVYQNKQPFFTYTLPLILAQERMNYPDEFLEQNFHLIDYQSRKTAEGIINFLEERKKSQKKKVSEKFQEEEKEEEKKVIKMEIEENIGGGKKMDMEDSISDEDEWGDDGGFKEFVSFNPSQNENFKFYKENSKVIITFRQKNKIVFDLENLYVEQKKLLKQILRNLNDFEADFTEKNKVTIPEIEQLTPTQQLTLLEFFLTHHNDLFMMLQSGHKNPHYSAPNCSICLDNLYDFDQIESVEQIKNNLKNQAPTDPFRFKKCNGDDHFFHLDCFKRYISQLPDHKVHIRCPNCQQDYGIKIGNMPPGKMSDKIIKYQLPGYSNYDTIEISYNFPSGMHKNINNGVAYHGTQRRAYLPNNEEGRKVLKLLKIAWERKLTFTVGTSVTTGLQNQVVWAGIHHKTSMSGGSFGYPDESYLQRVQQELADRGVV